MRPVVAVLTTALLAVVSTGVGLLASGGGQAPVPEWHITATVAESCSCAVSCSCNFGGNPNRMPCEGNRLISINKGHFGDVDLAGVFAAEMASGAELGIPPVVEPDHELLDVEQIPGRRSITGDREQRGHQADEAAYLGHGHGAKPCGVSRQDDIARLGLICGELPSEAP